MQRVHISHLVRALPAVALILAGLLPAGGCSSDPQASAVAPAAVAAPATAPSVASSTTLAPTSSTAEVATTLPAVSTATAPASLPPQPFSGEKAMAHIKTLAVQIGVRKAGTAAEQAAVDYAASYLGGLGYSVNTIDVPLPGGRVSHDVWAVREGSSPLTLVVGAHLDSMPPSPGANDNASGVGVVLELARDLRQASMTPTVVFALFGCEEVVDGNSNHHHYGSRQFVRSLSGEQAKDLAGMISVDMIAFGPRLAVRTMGRGPRELSDMLLAYASAHEVTAVYAKDTGPTGWSDHEAFEEAGYPVAWLERITDAAHHTAKDTYSHCDPALVQQTGTLLLGFLTGITQDDLGRLVAAQQLVAKP